MENYISALDLVKVYTEIENGNNALGYACSLGAVWGILTQDQKEWVMTFANKQLTEKVSN